MLTSDLYHSVALNFLQVTQILLFPDQIVNLTISEKDTLHYTLYADLHHSDASIRSVSFRHLQLITVTQKHCFQLSVSTRMILCRVLHLLCYSLSSLKLGTRSWYSTGRCPKLFTGQ